MLNAKCTMAPSLQNGTIIAARRALTGEGEKNYTSHLSHALAKICVLLSVEQNAGLVHLSDLHLWSSFV